MSGEQDQNREQQLLHDAGRQMAFDRMRIDAGIRPLRPRACANASSIRTYQAGSPDWPEGLGLRLIFAFEVEIDPLTLLK